MQLQSILGLAIIGASVVPLVATASSHREAPFISMQPALDGTDFYMFRSYEPGRSGYVTMIADYIPFQDPQGGPNFYPFDPSARYAINIDNNGDGKADLSFVFRFKTTSKQEALLVGGKQVKIPLIQSNTIPDAINPSSLNVRETYNVSVVRPDGDDGSDPVNADDDDARMLRNAATGSTEFDKPVDNIGDKTFQGPNGYEAYAAKHIYEVQIPGCGNGRLFVGQRKEPFYIAVGKIFDLFNLNPLGPEINGNKNDLENKNISSIILEVPIACVTHAGQPVIGAYTTASVPSERTLTSRPKTGVSPSAESGRWTQVSRLGMPLVNEVVIGRDDKDKFNGSRPIDDTKQFAEYVTNPTLPALIQTLFPSAKAPTNFPRTDLVTVFLTGIAGVNQPKNVVPAEMLRLNTAIAPTLQGQQNALGVAAGDSAGFPNGRRPGDDVVDLSLRVAMGALCVLTGPTDALKVGCKPSDAPAGALPFTDGVRRDAKTFQAAFPYLNTPIQGSFNN
ncbi:MAG: DUF4331 domain-containing protein [Pseudomonadota bacterium]|nr:DUF4331 domain-containing protein [Pseudomonadota bacterium]